MNKKFFVSSLVVFACVLDATMSVNLMAQAKDKASAAAEKAALEQAERLEAQRAALMDKVIQMLKSREWVVYVIAQPASGKSPEAIEADTLVFTDRTVKSHNLFAQGYAKDGSNYSLRIADNGTASWETMQLNENGQDIVFLRGELDSASGIMQGAIIYRPSKGKEKSCPYSTIKPQETALEPIGASAGAKDAGTAEKSKKKGIK